MTARQPESVLAAIPGWEHAAIEDLSGGLSNRSFLVTGESGKAVLKIDEGPRSAPYNSRCDEAMLQQTAAKEGLANRVLYADDGVYLTEYLEGTVWTIEKLDDDAALVDLARAMRGIHRLPLTGRTFDASAAARKYADRIEHLDSMLVKKNLAVVTSQSAPQNMCCCHNDLVPGNIISAPDIRFLDWEYACDNDPLFDLATIVAHNGLSTSRAHILLDAYFDGDGARWREKLASMEQFYEALLWLWEASRKADGTRAC